MPSSSLSGLTDLLSGLFSGPSAMEQYAEMVPESIDFQRWYYPWLQEQMMREPEEYPGGWNVEPHPYEGELMDMQRDRIGRIPDLAAAYEGAFEDYLPAYRRAYEEQTLKPAQERLEQMGMGDSTPGMGFLAALGEDQAISEAALSRDMQLGRADARQQMFNLEGAQMGTLWDMSQPHYQRGLQRQQFEYGDWLRQQGQPVDYAAQLGAPQTAMGIGSNLAQMYSSGAAADAQRFSAMTSAQASRYATDMGLYQTQWEAQFMAPYLAQANQPIPQQSGGKK